MLSGLRNRLLVSFPQCLMTVRAGGARGFASIRLQAGISTEFGTVPACRVDRVNTGPALWENAARDDQGRDDAAVLGLAVKLKPVGQAEPVLIGRGQPRLLPRWVLKPKLPLGLAGQR